jgi:hypothetical protein
MRRPILSILALALITGCGGGVEDTTCADVSRSSDSTTALVREAADDYRHDPEYVTTGLDEFCSRAKPDDRPYPALDDAAQRAYEAELEETRRVLGDDAADEFARMYDEYRRQKD